MLFQSFSLKKWIKLIFIGIMAGTIASSGFSGFSGDKTEKEDRNPPGNLSRSLKENYQKWMSQNPSITPGVIFGVLLSILIITTGIVIVFMWLGCRFRFIWLNALIYDSTLIKEPFKVLRRQGDSIFKVSVVVMMIVLLMIGVAGLCVYWIVDNGGADRLIFLRVLMVFIGIFVCFLILGVWNFMVRCFVMPVMFIDQLTYLPAWNKFLEIYRKNSRDIGIFLLLSIGVGIVCAILQGLIFIAFLIATIFLGGIIFGAGYVIFYILLKSKIVFIGFAIGAGIPFVIAFVFLMFAILLPFAVFYHVLNLYYLGSLNAGYTPLELPFEKLDRPIKDSGL